MPGTEDVGSSMDTCERSDGHVITDIFVSVRLYSDTMTAEAMSRVIGVEPTRTQAAVQYPKDKRTGRILAPKPHALFICTEHLCRSAHLDDHVKTLMDRIGDAKGIAELVQNPEVTGWIRVLQWSDGPADCSLSPASLLALGSIPLRVHFSIWEIETEGS